MYDIGIADQQSSLAIDEERLTDVVRRTLEAEQISAATISIAVVDNAAMHELNRDYLNHDYETDVLSFLLEASGGSDDPSTEPRGRDRQIDGEVIVSSEYAVQMAAELDWSPIEELTLYVVHGLLHLCGYDDLTEDELPVMRRRECEVFELLGMRKPLRAADDRGHLTDIESDSCHTAADRSDASTDGLGGDS